MTDATIELDASHVNKSIDKLTKAGKTRPLMDDVGRIMVTDTQLNFKSQRTPDGTPWKKTHRGGHILRKTGDLRNSIKYDLQGDDTVKIGTNLIYAPVHQFGATIKAKNAPYLRFMIGGKFISKKQVTIPARPFIGLEKRQVNKINAAIDRWADKLLG